MQAGFLDELTAMDADLDEIRGKAKTISTVTITTRLTAFKALRDKAQTYADLLGMQQDTIVDQLAGLTAKAQALILDDREDEDGGLETAPTPLEQLRADRHPTSPAADEPSAER